MGKDFVSLFASRVVNVASVPQRSPFRYPGGKTWLVPYVRLWLSSITPSLRERVELLVRRTVHHNSSHM